MDQLNSIKDFLLAVFFFNQLLDEAAGNIFKEKLDKIFHTDFKTSFNRIITDDWFYIILPRSGTSSVFDNLISERGKGAITFWIDKTNFNDFRFAIIEDVDSENQILKYWYLSNDANPTVESNEVSFSDYLHLYSFDFELFSFIELKTTVPELELPSVPGGFSLKYLIAYIQYKFAHPFVYSRPSELNIVGIRNRTGVNFVTENGVKRASSYDINNTFNDKIYVFYINNEGDWVLNQYNATTDPGDYYNTPSASASIDKGIGIMMPGQYYDVYKRGLHNGHQALRQKAPIVLFTDTHFDNSKYFLDPSAVRFLDRNDIITDPDGSYKKLPLCNIHTTISSGTFYPKQPTDSIGKWSAGCQVFAIAAEQTWDDFIDLCDTHKNLYGNSFSYTLVEEWDLIHFIFHTILET